MSDALSSGVTAIVPDPVLYELSLPTAATQVPDGEQIVTPVARSIGGRPLTVVGADLVWVIDDAVNFTLTPNVDGTATIAYPSEEMSTTVHVVDAATGLIASDDMIVTCSALDLGSAVDAQLEELRPGLRGSLLIVNQLNPSKPAPLWTTNANDFGIGFLLNDPHSTPPIVEDDPIATYLKAVNMFVPDAAELPIASVDRGNPCVVHVTGDLADLVANWHWTHKPVSGPLFQFKNWTGNNTSNALTVPPGGVVDSTTLRLGAHVTHGGLTYCCILRHLAGDADNADTDGVKTEPGVGTNWEDYWVEVPTLLVAPDVWALGAPRYYEYDSENVTVPLTADPASGTAKLRFAGGTGNHSLALIPGVGGHTAFGDIAVWRFKVRVKTNFKKNDGSGGDKGAEVFWHIQAFGGGIGFGGPSGDDEDGELFVGTSRYLCTFFDGTSYDPPASISGQFYKRGVVRGEYVDLVYIIQQPSSRGQLAKEWWFVDNEPVDVAGIIPTSNGQSYHESKTAAYPVTTPPIEFACRAQAASAATTVGGGGSMHVIGRQTLYAEIVYAVGWVNTVAGNGIHLVVTSEAGLTPPNAPFYCVIEVTDGEDNRMDVYTDAMSEASGRQKLLIPCIGGTATIVDTTLSTYWAGDGLGRVRVRIDPDGPGTVTFSPSMIEVANNDNLTGRTFDGEITVEVQP